MVDGRPSWDEYFLEITRVVATRSTCLRRRVGAVLVREKRILATGYNGAPTGLPHSLEVGCLRDQLGIPSGERQEICRGLHGEQNVLIQCALHGVSTRGAVLYCTHEPCITCAKMLINAGVVKVIFLAEYPDPLGRQMLIDAGVERVHWGEGSGENGQSAGV